jgi:hypothetical protein
MCAPNNTDCQAFFPVVRILSTHPLTRKGALLILPIGSKGGTHSLAGGGGGGTRFRRRDRHSGTLQYVRNTYPTVVYSYNPSTMGEVHLLDIYYSRVRS